MENKIGKTEYEVDAQEMSECRKIVKNLINFGISDKQKIQICYLLSLELESRDAMNMIIETVKKIKELDENVKYSLTEKHSSYNEDDNQNKAKLLEL
jgi:S-adenosylmethionine synthetase